jgi:PAS domain S-box-containing protein
MQSGLKTIFAAMALLLIGSVTGAYLMGIITLSKSGEVLRHRATIDQLRKTLATLTEAETGQRGYLLTGDDNYLIPYHDATQRITDDLHGLARHGAVGELPADQVGEVATLVQSKLDELEHTIDVRRSQGFEATVQIVKSDVGRQLMTSIRDHVQQLDDLEEQRLQDARHAAERFTAYRTATFIAVVLANLLFLLWAYRRIRREMAARQQAATEVSRQKELLSVTLASIGDAVIVTDNNARITFMNGVAEELTGWKLADATSHPVEEVFKIINEYTRQPATNPVHKVLQEGVIVGLANHTLLVRKDRTEVPIDDSGAPIRDAQGQVHGVVLVFRDFTQHKQQQRFLEQAKADAEAASRAKDQFLATLSHELRTPLTPVLFTLASWEASGTNLPDQYRDEIPMLRRNIELEARLIDDLLDLTRISRGRFRLNPEVVDVHDLLRSVQTVCLSDINSRQIKLSMRLEATKHHVRADSARVQQVFWNILRNAAKFAAEGGTVQVVSDNLPDGRIRVQITDDGIGMTRQTLERLFRPFEQGADDINRRYGGLGLGMALSKALLDVQDGTIEAHSDGQGKGATFTVTLPTVAPTYSDSSDGDGRSGHAGTGADRQRRRTSRKLQVLLVDDHIDTARTMSRLLSALGHQVKIADSCMSATKLLNADGDGDGDGDGQSFDLLISDIGLPDGTGIDLIRTLRQTRSVPAIALSGYGMEEDIAKCLEAGFNAHVTKPVNMQRLELVINQVTSETPGRLTRD